MAGVRQAPNSSAMASSNRENAHSASSRKLPPGWSNGTQASGFGSVKSELKSMAPGIKAESSFGSYQTQHAGETSGMNSFLAVKSEPKYAMPGAFQDDSSVASDSDIEIIPSSAFHDNGRRPTPSNGGFGAQSQRPGYSPETLTASSAALRRLEQSATNSALQQAIYGKQQLPNWMQNQPYPALSSGSSMEPFGYQPQQPVMGIGMGMPAGIPGQYVYPDSAYTLIGNGMPKQEPGLGYHANGYSNPQNSDSLLDIIGRANSQISSDPYGLDSVSRYDFSGQMLEQFEYIVNDPRKTNEEIKSLLENIRPDVDLPAESREGTPAGLKYPLVGY